jgi:hypothetical protein
VPTLPDVDLHSLEGKLKLASGRTHGFATDRLLGSPLVWVGVLAFAIVRALVVSRHPRHPVGDHPRSSFSSQQGVDRLEPCEDWRPYIVAAMPEPVTVPQG